MESKTNRSNELKLFSALAAAAVVTGVLAVMNNNAGRAANHHPVAEAGSEAAPLPAVKVVEPIVAKGGTGITVTKASDWEAQYPNEFSTYAKNSENEEHHSYIEAHPYIATLYKGYGFAIQ